MVNRQQLTAEFKREAVRQMRAGSKPIAQLARELGIPRNRLYKWNQAAEAHGEAEAFPGSGRRSAEQSELMCLRRALARAEQELEILRKATIYLTHPTGIAGRLGAKWPFKLGDIMKAETWKIEGTKTGHVRIELGGKPVLIPAADAGRMAAMLLDVAKAVGHSDTTPKSGALTGFRSSQRP